MTKSKRKKKSGKQSSIISTITSGKLKIIIPVTAAVVILAVFAGLMLFTDIFSSRKDTGNAPNELPYTDQPPGEPQVDQGHNSEGGRFDIVGHTEIKFTPGVSGTWDIRTSENGDSDPLLILVDQYDEVMYYNDNGEADMHDHYIDDGGDLNAFITTYLEAGITYTVEVRVYTNDGSEGRCTLTISFVPEEVIELIPIGIGDTMVTQDSWFGFTPEQSGIYEFRTSEKDGSDPYLLILDDELNNVIYDDNSGGDYSAFASVHLEAGIEYTIEIVFYIHGGEGTTLTISQGLG